MGPHKSPICVCEYILNENKNNINLLLHTIGIKRLKRSYCFIVIASYSTDSQSLT